jgi:ubiquinone/menaquinone biosynthesis C-methylase UbiE
VKAGHRILSLCCCSGKTGRALIRLKPYAHITVIDPGPGQIATARRKDKAGLIDYRIGNASDTGFQENRFDRVLIILALHEMPFQLRLLILREAVRVCRPGGRVIAIEHALITRCMLRFIRSLWWFTWVPGNPEASTTKELQHVGLVNEMKQAGLRIIKRYVTTPEWIEGIVGKPDKEKRK